MGRKSREKAARSGPSAGNLRRLETRERPIREAAARAAAEQRRREHEEFLERQRAIFLRDDACQPGPGRRCADGGPNPVRPAFCDFGPHEKCRKLGPPAETRRVGPLFTRGRGMSALFAMAALGMMEMDRRPGDRDRERDLDDPKLPRCRS